MVFPGKNCLFWWFSIFHIFAFEFSSFPHHFPFFLTPFFPVSQQKFPGKKCQGALCPLRLLRRCLQKMQPEDCSCWCGEELQCCLSTLAYVKHFHIKGVQHPWSLCLKTLRIFSKNKATLDKVSYGSGQKCSKGTQKLKFYFSRDHCCEVTVNNVQKSIYSMFWAINQ